MKRNEVELLERWDWLMGWWTLTFVLVESEGTLDSDELALVSLLGCLWNVIAL